MPDQRFPLHSKVGPFFLFEELASNGQMAWVYRAGLRQAPERQVVLKIARADGEYQHIFEQLLRHEANLLRDFRHPGIVHICPIIAYDRTLYIARAQYLAPYCHDVAPWYFAMEWLRGGSLEHHIHTMQNFPLPWKIELIYQIAIILDYIHLRGTAHLDLKPSNILFREPPHPERVPHPVLIDFGIAENESLAQHLPAATLRYAAPERVEPMSNQRAITPIVTGDNVNHPPADIFALGVIAYEILTGYYPFTLGNNREDLAYSILNEEPPSVAQWGLPAEVDRLLRLMLMKNREERPTIDQLITRLDTRLNLGPPRVSITSTS
ncbi:MAG: serine/threonine protein kinase [Anaerolineales bacterium]